MAIRPPWSTEGNAGLAEESFFAGEQDAAVSRIAAIAENLKKWFIAFGALVLQKYQKRIIFAKDNYEKVYSCTRSGNK
jgi:hypothetical protein